MKKIELILVEGNRILSESLKTLFDKQDDIKVNDSVNTLHEAVNKIKRTRADVMIVNFGTQILDGQTTYLEQLKNESNIDHLIVMDMVPNRWRLLELIKLGVSGFILKEATPEDFLSAVREVYNGKKVLPYSLLNTLFEEISKNNFYSYQDEDRKIVKLTRRERQIAALIKDGFSNKEIAHKLNISEFTVKSHVHNILEKHKLKSRLQLAKFLHAVKYDEEIKH